MILAQLLATLRKSNISLSLDLDGDILVDDPDTALTEDLLQQLRTRKGELVDYLQSLTQTGPQGITASANSGSYSLSSAQKRLWMIDQIEKGSVAYNIPNVVELDGAYDVKRFEEAINAVVTRHEILRTVFVKDQSGSARQWVLEPEATHFVLQCFDLREDPTGRVKANEFIATDLARAFDLSRWPLFNMAFFRLEEKKYLLYYNMSHIISDGWSMRVLQRDLMKYYEALRHGHEPVLPLLNIQYKDYTIWEQEQIGSGSWGHHQHYWTSRFKDIPPFSIFLLPGQDPLFSVTMVIYWLPSLMLT